MKLTEMVADAQRRAKRRLPKAMHELVLVRSEKGLTHRLNEKAFDQVGLRPRIAAGVGTGRDLSTSALGQELAFPVFASPARAPRLDSGGEVAVAEGVGAVGTAFGSSSCAIGPTEAGLAANPKDLHRVLDRLEQPTPQVELAAPATIRQRIEKAATKPLDMALDAAATHIRWPVELRAQAIAVHRRPRSSRRRCRDAILGSRERAA